MTRRARQRRRARILQHSRPWITAQDVRAVATAVRSGQLSPGPAIEQFESAAARTLGTAGAVATSSGTAALYLALRALGISRGDQVLCPSYVCSALLHAVALTGATPRLVEVDPATYNMDPDDARRRLGRRTRAIILPHLFGLPADLKPLQALGPALIEDCAQTLGVTYCGRPVGSFGAVAVCSFYATKMIAAGEGGMVASSSPSLLAKIRRSRAYDEEPRWHPSFNYKMSALHAALGCSQLSRLPQVLARRRRVAGHYTRSFAHLPVQLPHTPSDRGHGFYRYVIQVPGRAERIMAALARAGVTSRRPVYRPLHRMLGRSGFRTTGRVWRDAISLPIYPDLTDRELARVIDSLASALSRLSSKRRKRRR